MRRLWRRKPIAYGPREDDLGEEPPITRDNTPDASPEQPQLPEAAAPEPVAPAWVRPSAPPRPVRRYDEWRAGPFGHHGFDAFVVARDALVQCGSPPCPAGYMAANPAWCRPLGAWKRAFASWVANPGAEAVLHSYIIEIAP